MYQRFVQHLIRNNTYLPTYQCRAQIFIVARRGLLPPGTSLVISQPSCGGQRVARTHWVTAI